MPKICYTCTSLMFWFWNPLPQILRHGKGTWADPKALSLKNQWLQHLVLADPENERAGVRLTAVEGLAGVKFLDPDSFMGLAAEASCLAHRRGGATTGLRHSSTPLRLVTRTDMSEQCNACGYNNSREAQPSSR